MNPFRRSCEGEVKRDPKRYGEVIGQVSLSVCRIYLCARERALSLSLSLSLFPSLSRAPSLCARVRGLTHSLSHSYCWSRALSLFASALSLLSMYSLGCMYRHTHTCMRRHMHVWFRMHLSTHKRACIGRCMHPYMPQPHKR